MKLYPDLHRWHLIPLCMLCIQQTVFAQTLQRVDPLEAGFAGSTIGRTGSGWFLQGNPASLASTEKSFLFGSFSPSAAGIEGYKEGAFVGGIAIGSSIHVGVNGAAFGVEGYSEAAGGVVAAVEIDRVRIGATFLLQSVAIELYGSSVLPLLDIGAQVEISSEAVFGASFINATRSAVTDLDIPQRLGLGFMWQPDSTLSLSIDAVQELRRDPGLAFGIEYEPLRNLPMRLGFASEPGTIGFGLGFRMENVLVDYGGSYVDPLGFRHVFSAGMTW